MIDPGRWLAREKEAVDAALLQYLPVERVPRELYEATAYSLKVGGKRLRPLLTLAVADLLGADKKGVMKIACAVEYIHTYSLIHDDLPAMDDSNLRRGRATCHLVYGEAAAILAGDALLTMAFELVSDYGMEEPSCAVRAVQIGRELARSAGMAGMVGGQVLDLQGEGKDLTLEELSLMNSMKTGALLQAAARCGALAAGASAEKLQAVTRFAARLGLAFQIVDDLLDRERSAEDLGKTAGADDARSKATYPSIMGSESARSKVEDLYMEAVSCIEPLEHPGTLLRELARRLVFRVK